MSDTPSTSELIEGVLFFPIALVISSTIFPGFILCIPGLLFVTVLILIPIIAMAIVAIVAASVIAAPFLIVCAVRGLRVPGYLTAPAHAMRRRGRGAPQPVK